MGYHDGEAPYFEVREAAPDNVGDRKPVGFYFVLVGADGKDKMTSGLFPDVGTAKRSASEAIGAVNHLSILEPIR